MPLLVALAFSSAALAQELSQVDQRVPWWEKRAFLCDSPSGPFPSKEAASGAPSCDDGDSIMFNSLLCRSGDARGCQAVKLSQDEAGRFWRSPLKRHTKPAEPSGMKGGETTFSGDHATGLLIYFGHTNDSDAFARWVRWIDANERCDRFENLCTFGTPRYCKNDRCAFRVGDCQMMLLLGKRLGVAVPFCSALPFAQVPTFVDAAQRLKKAYDSTIARFPAQPPELKLLRDNFDKILAAYNDLVKPIEELRTNIQASLVKSSSISQIIESVSAKVNDRGFSRHNAVAKLMILQDWGMSNRTLNSVAEAIAKDEPLNPFFQFVAYRNLGKDKIIPLVLDQCPSETNDPQNLRRQWSWERDTSKREWNNRMYWDCIFIANMVRISDSSNAPSEFDLDSATRLLSSLIASAGMYEVGMSQIIERLGAFADALPPTPQQIISNPGQTIRNEILRPVNIYNRVVPRRLRIKF